MSSLIVSSGNPNQNGDGQKGCSAWCLSVSHAGNDNDNNDMVAPVTKKLKCSLRKCFKHCTESQGLQSKFIALDASRSKILEQRNERNAQQRSMNASKHGAKLWQLKASNQMCAHTVSVQGQVHRKSTPLRDISIS